MSVPYIPMITTGGELAAITERENGFAFEVTHMSFGTGSYVMTGNETALANEVARVPIAGGGKIAGMLSLVINTILRDADLNVGVGQPVNIKEIGFWNEDVLFAIYSVNTVLFTKHLGLDFAMTYSLALKTLMPIDAANITVVINESASITLALIGQHLAGANPHPQYATVIMLEAEIAALLDLLENEATTRENADDAISDALDEEESNRITGDENIIDRMTANGIDADLGITNNLTLNNLNGLSVVGKYFVHLLDGVPFPYGKVEISRENENLIYQEMHGHGTARIATRHISRAVNTDPFTTLSPWLYYATLAELAAETATRISEDARVETDRVNGDLALSIALAAEITNRVNGDNAVLAKINNVVFGTANYYICTVGTGNTFTLQPNSTIRVILIGGGGGSGAGGGGGGGYGGTGLAGGDSFIYPSGNPTAFFVKAKGGLGGGSAYGGNGSSYAIGSSPNGQGVDINNWSDVVILSYQDGLKGDYAAATADFTHPAVKQLGFAGYGKGRQGVHDGYYAIGGGASSGSFVEALIINRSNTPLTLTIDIGGGGVKGVGINKDGTTINGLDGIVGIGIVIC